MLTSVVGAAAASTDGEPEVCAMLEYFSHTWIFLSFFHLHSQDIKRPYCMRSSVRYLGLIHQKREQNCWI